MRRVVKNITFVVAVMLVFAFMQNAAYADGTASVAGLYPAAEVPIGATVTFSIITSGFTNPTYYLVDSFPGGVTSTNINSSGDFSWTPNTDDVGTHGLTITVSDPQGDSASVSQQIIVDGAASVSIQSLVPGTSVSIGTPITFSVSAYGLLNPTYTAGDSFFNSSLMQSAINTAGVFSWTPIFQDIGTHTITVTAKDVYGNSATSPTVIIVFPSATASITGLAPGTSVNAGSTLSFTATSTGFINPAYAVYDAFIGISTSTIVVGPTGTANWVPTNNDIGVHPISLVVSDSTGRSATTTVSITVLPPLPTPATQTVTPAATTSATQTTPPAAFTTPATPPMVAPVTIPTKKTTPPSPTPQKTTAVSVPFATPALSFTATTSTNNTASTTPTVTLETQVVIPPNTPTESMTEFFFLSTINFFVSIFKLL